MTFQINYYLFLMEREFIHEIYMRIFFYTFLFLAFNQFSYTFRYYQSSSFRTQEYKNPYSTIEKHTYKKASFHLHSDEVFYTPERHSTRDIIDVYKQNGYDIISISDYNQITIPSSIQENTLSAYEWGSCIRKRHLLALGINEIAPNNFFISFLGNIQFAINFIKQKGGYVVINHPKLYSAFSIEDLMKLWNYDAIEVLSPFGDIIEFWDTLLSNGKRVHCMASDDLHYLPESYTKNLNQSFFKNLIQNLFLQRGREGEALLRYVVLSAQNTDSESILNALKSGDFYCVKKFYRTSPDPKVPKIFFQNNKIVVRSEEKFFRLEFIGKNGTVLKSILDSQTAEYELKPDDIYGRVTIYSLSGVILSNPMFFQNSK